VLRLAGRSNEGVPVLEGALRLYAQKGDIVSGDKARAVLTELQRNLSPAS
jgi:hypothetical protein